MEDERNTGGFGWSTVGQLAADRPPETLDDLPVLEDDVVLPPPRVAETATEVVEVEPPEAPGDVVADPAAHWSAPAPPDPPDVLLDPPPADGRRQSAVVRPLPRFMAIANQKGGVGKTTTAVNLGAALAELGYRVLVVDLDPQGNATTGLGINARNLQSSIYDVLLNDLDLEDCVEPTAVRNLFLAPATIDLAGAEIELVPAFSRELRLRRALERVGDDYDFVMIDCPPSLGLLTVNGLAAASEVVVPIQCEYYALEGLSQLLRNVELGPGLAGVGGDGPDRQLLVGRLAVLGHAARGDQCPQPSTQPALARHRSPPWPARGRRWRHARSGRTR